MKYFEQMGSVKISFVCSSIFEIQVKSTRYIRLNYSYVGSAYSYTVNLASSTKVLSWHSGNFSEKRVQAGGSSLQGAL
jgi:hypothetical protein